MQKSPDDYAKKTNQFYKNQNRYQVKVDEYGITRVYDSNTNTFGSYNPDGTTRTYMKPRSKNYWNNQPGKLK